MAYYFSMKTLYRLVVIPFVALAFAHSASALSMVCVDAYAPVCGRPAGCANTCPSGAMCTMMCRLHDPQTYSNRCRLSAAGAEFLYEGVCQGTTPTPQPAGLPVIQGLSGPTTLSVNESGTWSVTAYSRNGGQLTYAIDWGDAYPTATRYNEQYAYSQRTTFTHAYTRAGTYTVRVTAYDSYGGSTSATATVVVSQQSWQWYSGGTTPCTYDMYGYSYCDVPSYATYTYTQPQYDATYYNSWWQNYVPDTRWWVTTQTYNEPYYTHSYEYDDTYDNEYDYDAHSQSPWGWWE